MEQHLSPFVVDTIHKMSSGDTEVAWQSLIKAFNQINDDQGQDYTDLSLLLLEAGGDQHVKKTQEIMEMQGFMGPGHLAAYATVAARMIEKGHVEVFDFWLNDESPYRLPSYLFTFLKKTTVGGRDLLAESFAHYVSKSDYMACVNLLPHLSLEYAQLVLENLEDDELQYAIKEMTDDGVQAEKIALAKAILASRTN